MILESLKNRSYVIVDVETTGGSSIYDRIIEIGMIRIENGVVVKTFQSLVNPGRSVPPSIELITGIKSQDLESAPSFEDIGVKVNEILDGCIFIAHNARFDYGFIKNELKRIGITYNAKCLCTVRLSRKIYKRYKSHDLSTIISRHDLECQNRHRAYDDAFTLQQFIKKIEDEGKLVLLKGAIDEILKHSSLPQFLDSKSIESLPENVGVYIFYGPDEELLYIGKSRNIRYRVLSHFSNDHRESKGMRISEQVTKVDFIETSGELGALLLESDMIKKLSPLYNRALRRKSELVLAKKKNIDGYDSLILERVKKINPENFSSILGIFRSISQAKLFLRANSDEFNLCHKILGLEKTAGSCFHFSLEKCLGACIEKEKKDSYNERFALAFKKRKLQSWPFRGAVLIEERKDDHIKHSFLLDNWCFIAEAKRDQNESQVKTLSPEFDYDSYKIILRYLSNPYNKKNIKVISEKERKLFLKEDSSLDNENIINID